MKKLEKMNEKLFIRYLNHETSAPEALAVEKWRKASQEHEILFEQYQRLWQKENYDGLLSTQDLHHDWNMIRNRMGFEKRVDSAPDAIWQAFGRIAAVVVLMLCVSGALWTYWNVPGFGRWTAFETAGSVDSLRLPDNSMVFLNQYSSLTYRNNFGEGKRKVILHGEGYFEVTSDVNHPFSVDAGNRVAVEVVGTAFHIQAPEKLAGFELNVTDGTVLFKHKKLSRSVKAGNSARVIDGGIEVCPIESPNFISWKTGQLEFVGSSLLQIIDALKQHFIQIKEVQLNTSSDVMVTTRFVNQPLSEIIEELEIHFDKKMRLDEGILIISD